MSTTDYGKYYDEQMKGKLNEELAILDEQHKADVLETNQAYQSAINMQNVQRLINERKISEAMSNAGLTDSGLNRTQQTATQLSYNNAVAQLEIEKQKKVDSLALALRQQKNALETNYQAGKTEYVQEAQKIEQEAIKSATDAAIKEAEYNENAYKTWTNFVTAFDKEDDHVKKSTMLDGYLYYHPNDDVAQKFAVSNGYYKYKKDSPGEIEKIERSISHTSDGYTKITDSSGDRLYKIIRNDASAEGKKINSESTEDMQIIDTLKKVFMVNKSIDEYLEACKTIGAGYSTAELDAAMSEIEDKQFQVLWALATNNSDKFPNDIVKQTDDGGKRGGDTLDRNAKIKINGVEKTIGQWHRYLKNKCGLSPAKSKEFLKKFGD